MLKKKLLLGMKKKCLKTDIPLQLECFIFNLIFYIMSNSATGSSPKYATIETNLRDKKLNFRFIL